MIKANIVLDKKIWKKKLEKPNPCITPKKIALK